MPRLSNARYYERYEFLRWVWLKGASRYRYISSQDQYAIHDYYQPSRELTFEELVKHRKNITLECPALPSKASKAYFRFIEANVAKTAPAKTGGRNLYVRSVVNPEIDVKALARAFANLAQHISRKEDEGQDDKSAGTPY